MNENILQAIGSGFLMQMGIIMSLGMQNMYVIKKGIRKEFPFWVAMTCGICEIILMTIGVMGASAIFNLAPGAKTYLMFGAAAFLVCYGLRSLKTAFFSKEESSIDTDSKDEPSSLWASILAAIGFSLLNPQAIFESILFFGGVAPKYGTLANYFLLGAVLGSFVWLLSLAGATTFALPKAPSPRAMRMLEGASGGLLVSIGFGMVL